MYYKKRLKHYVFKLIRIFKIVRDILKMDVIERPTICYIMPMISYHCYV